MNTKLLLLSLALHFACQAHAFYSRNTVYDENIMSLQAVVNSDWLSPAVMTLGSSDVLNISFDELSHDYIRYTYHIDHCEADWSLSEGIFESDYLRGFNDNVIDDFETSVNTTVLYTHYTFSIPNDRCRLTLSGNYRLTICDEDGNAAATVDFMVAEKTMTLGLGVTTNTDIDVRGSHQQVLLTLNYDNVDVTNPEEQLYTVVMKNDCPEEVRINVKPDIKNNKGMQWNHCRDLIFDGGNEYYKYEVLDVSHATLGLESVTWDGEYFNAWVNTTKPRSNYLYDEDADGAFYIRNSDNIDNDITSDYIFVHYRHKSPLLTKGLRVEGRWTSDADKTFYDMNYDGAEEMYYTEVLQKQGYYSYRYVMVDENGAISAPYNEGSFYQTENRYQGYVYFKGRGERTWRLVAYRQTIYKP